MKHIVILGAGISGLSLGWFLKKQYGDEIQLTILEKADRAGGWIRTIKQDGFLFELGPRSCRPYGNGVATLKLIEDLGLQEEVVVGDPSAHRRYLWWNQKLCEVPSGVTSSLFSPLTSSLLPAFLKEWWVPKGKLKDESIHSFISRRFNREVAERLIDPLTSGIFAGDCQKLSLKSCFPLFYQMEQDYGSLMKGMLFRKKKNEKLSPFIHEIQKSSLFSFRGGMETLTTKLASKLSENLFLSKEVQNFSRQNQKVQIELMCGTHLEADHLFSTIPVGQLAPYFSCSLSEMLQEIESVPVAVVCLGFREKILKKEGFGYLIPSREKESILGVVWDSCVFPEQNSDPEETRLTVMLGGAHFPEIEELPHEALLRLSLEALERHMRIDVQPDTYSVNLFSHSIPQYTLGHHERVSKIEQALARSYPQVSVLGNGLYGVAVNDCIAKSLAFSKNL